MNYLTNWWQDRKIDCRARKRIVLRYKIGCYFLSRENFLNRRKKGPIYYINHIYSFSTLWPLSSKMFDDILQVTWYPHSFTPSLWRKHFDNNYYKICLRLHIFSNHWLNLKLRTSALGKIYNSCAKEYLASSINCFAWNEELSWMLTVMQSFILCTNHHFMWCKFTKILVATTTIMYIWLMFVSPW